MGFFLLLFSRRDAHACKKAIETFANKPHERAEDQVDKARGCVCIRGRREKERGANTLNAQTRETEG